jgi:hypothetical protein
MSSRLIASFLAWIDVRGCKRCQCGAAQPRGEVGIYYNTYIDKLGLCNVPIRMEAKRLFLGLILRTVLLSFRIQKTPGVLS